MILNLKTRHAISCAVNFYNAGDVTKGRKIGSWSGLHIEVNYGLDLRITLVQNTNMAFGAF
jgi:hypothetical protein